MKAATAIVIFQFHKGTIRTEYEDRKADTPQFQFHKGTIRTTMTVKQESTISYFNSIKVQLEHYFTGDFNARI